MRKGRDKANSHFFFLFLRPTIYLVTAISRQYQIHCHQFQFESTWVQAFQSLQKLQKGSVGIEQTET